MTDSVTNMSPQGARPTGPGMRRIKRLHFVGIGGAAIRVAACLGAISVAEFVGFNNAITAADTAVIVVIIVAPSRAAPVAV